MEVTLQQILDAREQRVFRQQALLKAYGKPLLCFTMNIAGPEKNNALITAGFHLGLNTLDIQLHADRIPVLQKEVYEESTGCEGFYVLDANAAALKQLAVQIEDLSLVGRLFDMDVLTPDGQKVSRESLGLPGRTCLLCGGPVHICSRSRAHSVEALQEKTRALLQEAVYQRKAERIGALAIKSLLTEVCTTPKPGLVDRSNCGSHKDMDIFTFMGSCAALQPYFTRCALIGLQKKEDAPKVVFETLRYWGKQAEQTMLEATDGVNTHKGAIFTLGLLCAAAGRCDSTDPAQICAQVAAMTTGITKLDLTGKVHSVGEKLYVNHGITGIRGQAEAGFPALTEVGLPKLDEGLSKGLTLEEAGCAVLLHLMCTITDTNLIARSDLITQQAVCKKVRALLDETPFPNKDAYKKLDNHFIEANLSPGGSADLLAATYFLHYIKTSL